jgi:hypothetical protein
MWTKRELVLQAFGELALYGYEFELTPEEMQTGLVKMDSMLAEWQAADINIGYALPATQDGSDLDDASGIPDTANTAVFLNLAMRLAAGFGKTLSAETKVAAKQAYDRLLWAAAYPRQQQYPSTLPVGAGNKPWRYIDRPFMPTPDTSPIQGNKNGNLDILEG